MRCQKYAKLFIERMRKIWYEPQTDVSMELTAENVKCIVIKPKLDSKNPIIC